MRATWLFLMSCACDVLPAAPERHSQDDLPHRSAGLRAEANPSGGSDPSWTTTADMATGRMDHIALKLTDGRVLVAGGIALGATTATAEIYDPATATWASTAPLATARHAAAGVVLGDGRVLVVGGVTGNDSLASAEIFDPIAGTWTATGSLIESRIDHTATLLADGSVLVVGGSYAPFSFGCGTRPSAELWNPSTGQWTATASVGGAFGHTATRLSDGSVLVAGGIGRGFNGVFCVDNPVAQASIYHPGDATVTTADNMNEARGYASATLLADGRVLVAGGVQSSLLASAELYDPQADAWTTTDSLSEPHVHHQAARLADGRILIADGTSAELYDPAAETWSAAPALRTPRTQPTLTSLSSGGVVAAGGSTNAGPSAAVELYSADGTTCGDGAIQGGEACDGADLGGNTCVSLGYASGTLACTAACTLDTSACSLCGNGTIDAGEQCDDGNTDNADGCLACVLARCGDGHVHAGVEQCDDGNAVDDDACRNDCTIPTTCTLPPPTDQPPEVEIAPDVDWEGGVGAIVTLEVETTASLGGPSSTQPCVYDLPGATATGKLCIALFGEQQCISITGEDSGTIEYPTICTNPPRETCDLTRGCQTDDETWTLTASDSWGVVYDAGPVSCEALIGAEGFGGITRHHKTGPGCGLANCPGGDDRFSGQVGLRAKGDLGCEVRIAGLLVDQVELAKVEACASVLTDETGTCGQNLEPSISGGFHLQLGSIEVAWLKMNLVDLKYPMEGAACLSE